MNDQRPIKYVRLKDGTYAQAVKLDISFSEAANLGFGLSCGFMLFGMIVPLLIFAALLALTLLLGGVGALAQ